MSQTQYFRLRNWPKFQRQSQNHSTWAKLHFSILDDHALNSLTTFQQLVAIKLIALSGRIGRALPWDCSYIARTLQLDCRRIGTALEALESIDFIELCDRTSNIWESLEEEKEKEREIEKKETPSESPKKVARKLAVVNNTKILGFDDFWEAYPRKVARKAALAKYEKIVRDGEATETDLLTGAQAYSAYCQSCRRDKEKIAHPTTWLNQGRWDDDTTIQRQPTKSEQVDMIFAARERMRNGDGNGNSGNYHQTPDDRIRAASGPDGGPRRIQHDS